MDTSKLGRYLLLFLVALVTALALAFYTTCSRLKAREAEIALISQRPQKTDTVYVNRVYRDTIRIVQKAKPRTVYVYTQPDTARRRRLEQDTIIGGIRLDSRKLEVELLTPKGVSLVESYRLPHQLPVQLELSQKGQVSLVVDPYGTPKKVRKNKALPWVVGLLLIGGYLVAGAK